MCSRYTIHSVSVFVSCLLGVFASFGTCCRNEIHLRPFSVLRSSVQEVPLPLVKLGICLVVSWIALSIKYILFLLLLFGGVLCCLSLAFRGVRLRLNCCI